MSKQAADFHPRKRLEISKQQKRFDCQRHSAALTANSEQHNEESARYALQPKVGCSTAFPIGCTR
jgi:hypothetical protein